MVGIVESSMVCLDARDILARVWEYPSDYQGMVWYIETLTDGEEAIKNEEQEDEGDEDDRRDEMHSDAL